MKKSPLQKVLSNLPWEKIKYYAAINQLPYELVAAIILTESSGNPYAARFEPCWEWYQEPKLYAKELGITEDTERVFQATSWGLMQIIGTCARELGYSIELPRLAEVDKNLQYGCRKLGVLFHKYNLSECISAYNAGHPVKSNQAYVDKVLTYIDSVERFKILS